MPNYMLVRADKLYLTDGTIAGTKAIAEAPRYFSNSRDTVENDGRFSFFETRDGIQAIDALTGQISDVPVNTGNFHEGFSAPLPGGRSIFMEGGEIVTYTPGRPAVVVEVEYGDNYREELVSFAGRVYFAGRDTVGAYVAVTDGTESGTDIFDRRSDADVPFAAIGLDQDWIVNGRMLYATRDTFEGRTLRATDGTSSVELITGIGAGGDSGLVRFGGQFALSARMDADDRWAIWGTDGSQAGTVVLADEDSLLAAYDATIAEDIAPASLRLTDGLSTPFVINDRLYVATQVDYNSLPDYTPSGGTVIFDVTTGSPTVSTVAPRYARLLPGPNNDDGLFGSTAPPVSVSASGVVLYEHQRTLYAMPMGSDDAVALRTLNDPLDQFRTVYDLGSHMIVLLHTGLVSVDLATLTITDIIRDVEILDQIEVLNGLLYWRDEDGIHATDGTVAGTRLLAGAESGPFVTGAWILGDVTLGAGVFERLTTLGDDVIDLRSSTRNERIEGGAGNDRILTGTGADYLDGGPGIDTLSGGRGNDLYIVNDSRDRVIELAGAGFDTIRAAFSTVLAANVETLVLTGGANLTGTGNALNNAIGGNGGNNVLHGMLGNDSLYGGFGNDTLYGGAGADLVQGGAGADWLIGGPGADRLVGGAGNDVYVIDTADTVVELRDGGYDTIRASFSAVLAPHVEALTLLGNAHLTGTGNALNNVIGGNPGNNVLHGLAGHDTLYGGAGRDTLFGGANADWLYGGPGQDRLVGGIGHDTYVIDRGDTVVEFANGGFDTVRAGFSHALAPHVEALLLLGNAHLNGFGNALNNRILGNAGNNDLRGFQGNDTLNGGAGADRLTGGLGADVLVGGALRDVFVFASVMDSRPGAGRDTILDFRSGVDDIDLRAIDADWGAAGDQAFRYSGNAAAAHAVWFVQQGGNTLVRGDANGDRIADFEIRLTNAGSLGAADFLL